MKYSIIICSLILLFSGSVLADLEYLTTEEHLQKSDLVVIGTLKDVSEYNNGTSDYGQGKIEVEAVLSKNIRTDEGFLLKPGDKLQMNWTENFACTKGSHKRTENKKGIWALTVEEDGTVSTRHPGRFMSLDELNKVKKYLAKTESESPKKSVSLAKSKVEENLEKTESGNPKKSVSPAKPDSTADALIRALLVFIVALILYRLLYRARFKVKVKRKTK